MRTLTPRLAALLVTTTMLLIAPAQAQGPVVQQSPGSPAAAPAQPTDAIPQEQEPARAPGSQSDAGTTLAPANANAGSTTTFSETKPLSEVQWPCAQRKVSTISAGTIWSGPDVAQGADWDQDNDLAALAQTLASRRTGLDEADTLIADFAKKAGAEKDKQLTKLFVGTLDIINGNRDQILQGITRYARGQERLAERMRDESDKISESQGDATAADLGVAVDQQNKDFAWDQRIFKERKQALSYVCETPSLLERRAYDIAKRIQAQL